MICRSSASVVRRCARLALALPCLTASPALAQMYNAGDPCPEPTPGRVFTQEGAAGPALVCNGTTLEVYESIKTGPMRKGVGTANPAAMLDVAGEAKIGNTSLACSATTEGAMRYNSTSKEMEYCNGTAWGSLAPAAGGGGLKVYKSDGTTVLGNLVGSYAAGCAGLIYANTTTGAVYSLDTSSCLSTVTISSTIYFSTSTCSGASYAPAGGIGYCCTGVGSCTTNICRANPADPPASHAYSSYRAYDGSCSSWSSSASTSSSTTGLDCGSGDCLVK